ncbi:MAG: hypothetical protein IKA85_07430 [Clostridia bacterium]|nr:hypothetical protein [Clostridia bacterium]
MQEKWLNLLKKLKKPTGWLLFITYFLTVTFCGVAIALAVVNSSDPIIQILSYVSYAGAMVTLSYSVYSIVIYAPKMKKNTVNFIKKFKLGEKLLNEYGFRTMLFAFVSLIINVAFVVYHVVLAFITDTFYWYISLAIYYGLLVILRGGIVLYHRKRTDKDLTEIRKFRNAGIILMLIPICLLVPILQILFLDRAFVHPGLTIFVFATYSFYKIIMATYNLFRSGKEPALTVQAIRYIGLADALVSIFSLQTALLYAFSDGTDFAYFNAITGFAVFVLTVTLGIFMIKKANKKFKERKNTNE